MRLTVASPSEGGKEVVIFDCGCALKSFVDICNCFIRVVVRKGLEKKDELVTNAEDCPKTKEIRTRKSLGNPLFFIDCSGELILIGRRGGAVLCCEVFSIVRCEG